MKNNEPKAIEKEKIVAEKLNGRFAMLGFVALVGAYLTTGQIIPGFIQKIILFFLESYLVNLTLFLYLSLMGFKSYLIT